MTHPGAWGLVEQPAYEYAAGLGQLDHSGHVHGFDNSHCFDNGDWGAYLPCHVSATRHQGASSCWNPACDRDHTGTYWQAL